jgi:hypothetical protein
LHGEVILNFYVMFGTKPNEYSSLVMEKDHPELDNTPESKEPGCLQDQSLNEA